jgi:hypothetical protein
MKPEQTQGGGIAGGTFIGAPNVNTASPLSALAESLGVAGQTVTRGLTQGFLDNIETRKKEALDAAAVFEQTTAGYTAEQLGAEIESEPMAAKFKANPYLLPAINVYRGRRTADDLALRMAEEGVDSGDAEAVKAFYQNNAPDLADPFFARGFNEQNARLQAQFNQQQLKDAFAEAEADAVAGAAQLWKETFETTLDPAAATEAVRGSVFGKTIDGKKLAAIQIDIAGSLAVEGNVEAFEALVDRKRGDAPALSEDAIYARDVAVLRSQAMTERTQQTQGLRNAAMTSALKMVNRGVSEAALRASPEWEAMADFRQEEGAMSQEQKQIINALESRREQIARENAQRAITLEFDGAINRATEAAAALLEQGNGYKITDAYITDANGNKVKRVPASTLVTNAINFLRAGALGTEPFSLQGEDAKKYRAYTDGLTRSGYHDPQLKRAISGMASSLTVEGIQENPESAVQALNIWRNMGESARRTYAPEGPPRTILEVADKMLGDNPRMAPEAALRRAVTLANSPVTVAPKATTVKNSVNQIRLTDPEGSRSWFGFGPPKKFAPDKVQLQEFVTDRMNERMAFGMSEEDAADATAKEASEMFVAFNGVAVRLPEKPLKSGASPSPEAWARDLKTFADGLAASAEVPADEIKLVWLKDNTYSVVRQPPEEEELPQSMGYVDASAIYADALSSPTPSSDRADNPKSFKERATDKYNRKGAAGRVTEGFPEPSPSEIPY